MLEKNRSTSGITRERTYLPYDEYISMLSAAGFSITEKIPIYYVNPRPVLSHFLLAQEERATMRFRPDRFLSGISGLLSPHVCWAIRCFSGFAKAFAHYHDHDRPKNIMTAPPVR